MRDGKKKASSEPPLKLVDVIINLLHRDLIGDALETIVTAIDFATENEMTTEDAIRMPLEEMVKLIPAPPQKMPYVRQVEGWDHVFYGDAAFKEEQE